MATQQRKIRHKTIINTESGNLIRFAWNDDDHRIFDDYMIFMNDKFNTTLDQWDIDAIEDTEREKDRATIIALFTSSTADTPTKDLIKMLFKQLDALDSDD